MAVASSKVMSTYFKMYFIFNFFIYSSAMVSAVRCPFENLLDKVGDETGAGSVSELGPGIAEATRSFAAGR